MHPCAPAWDRRERGFLPLPQPACRWTSPHRTPAAWWFAHLTTCPPRLRDALPPHACDNRRSRMHLCFARIQAAAPRPCACRTADRASLRVPPPLPRSRATVRRCIRHLCTCSRVTKGRIAWRLNCLQRRPPTVIGGTRFVSMVSPVAAWLSCFRAEDLGVEVSRSQPRRGGHASGSPRAPLPFDTPGSAGLLRAPLDRRSWLAPPAVG